MKFFVSLYGVLLLIFKVKTFNPEKVFKSKSVAIVGAADSAFQNENGDFINSFDVVVRINKAIITWKPEYKNFIGSKTDVLFHSFYENEESGGGKIDLQLFKRFNIKYLVQPDNSVRGLKTHLNFYKRNKKPVKTYLLSKKKYEELRTDFLKKWIPTVGCAALYSVLSSPCEKVYITGFTFFKTAYASGYRDHLLNKKFNEQHIKDQGLHNPDLEFQAFKKMLKNTKCGSVVLDETLSLLVEMEE